MDTKRFGTSERMRAYLGVFNRHDCATTTESTRS